MGSKRAMLRNGLGTQLNKEISSANRFVDLFAGSGSVATYVAQLHEVQVLAFDLQNYSAVITEAVIGRQTKLNWQAVWAKWHEEAKLRFNAEKIPTESKLTQAVVSDFRSWAAEQVNLQVTKVYGGHYFSPEQAVWIDMLRAALPGREPARTVALAALIQAASQCTAAPGHTAQPFQPTRTAKPFLQEAWSKDIVQRTQNAFASLAAQFAKRRGHAQVADANEAAKQVRESDLVFIDPPYSGVHYSRFYHVLETLAGGDCGEVSGVGRYPARDLRPRSKYSLKKESTAALDDLLGTIASCGAKAVLTFPARRCSNGLSGQIVRRIASKHFRVIEMAVTSRFSTLGGNGVSEDGGRNARQNAKELILVLHPS